MDRGDAVARFAYDIPSLIHTGEPSPSPLTPPLKIAIGGPPPASPVCSTSRYTRYPVASDRRLHLSAGVHGWTRYAGGLNRCTGACLNFIKPVYWRVSNYPGAH